MAKLREREDAVQIKKGDTVGESTETKQTLPGMVTCMHGMHDCQAPVKGLTVAEARKQLKKTLHIDDAAVCLLGGEIVPEDTVIPETALAVTWVKQAAVKGG